LTAKNSINSKLIFQQEEKAKQEARREARLNVKRANAVALESKAKQAMENYDNREQQNIILRGARQDKANV